MKKLKDCNCINPDVMVEKMFYCKNCGGSLRKKVAMYSLRGWDDCQGMGGLTDFSGQFKIWKCDHYIYCPLCGWRCKDVDELKKHLEGFSSLNSDRRLCDGFFYYGQYGIDIVINEIKYFKLRKHTRSSQTDKGKVKKHEGGKDENV